ncbi:MAG: hypothetical protein RL318_26 [Fibrobacterota bacterium]|jgi:DNA gyrase/topoisomerase IV subunit B
MLHLIMLLGLLQSAPSSKEVVERCGSLSHSELEGQLKRSNEGERGIIHLFLAAGDSTGGPSLDSAWTVLDSLQRAKPSALHAALLGTADALQARRTRGDVIVATRWVGKAIEHLDAAVAADSMDLAVRIFRINSLVEVPEIFHVDKRLRRDEAFLRARFPKLAQADAGTLLALAALNYRFGNLGEATALWKLVAGRKIASVTQRAQARRRLESIRG